MSVILYSCALPRESMFIRKNIQIGMNENYIRKTFGIPFSFESYSKDNNKIDILRYKELVRVVNYPYAITTILYFENATLKSIKQEDKYISDREYETEIIKK